MDADPAWPLVRSWSAEAENEHELLAAEPQAAAAALAALGGLTERSVLGALARHCAALVVERWLVVLGAGGQGFPGLGEANAAESAAAVPGALVVGIDVAGGGFAVNGGGLPGGDLGEVCYLGPDDLRWLPCGFGHSAFVYWALNGPLHEFYADLRWDGWRDDVAALAAGDGIAAYPPAWSREGQEAGVHRSPVPLLEAWELVRAAAARLGPGPDAGP